MIPTPISEESNDDDHVTSEWYSNLVLEVMLLDHDEPTNYEEAMMSLDSVKWLEDKKSKMRSMYENKVWTLIDLPNDRRAIEIKWIFQEEDGR